MVCPDPSFYYLAKHQDAANTALQMGHVRMDVLFNHYRELVTRDDAEKYWNIAPSRQANTVQMTA